MTSENKSVAQLQQELREARSIVAAVTVAAVDRGRDNYNSVKLAWEKYDRIHHHLTMAKVREALIILDHSEGV